MTDKPYRVYDVRAGSAWVHDPLQHITRGYVRRNGHLWTASLWDSSSYMATPVNLTVDPDLTGDELRDHCLKLLKAQGMGRAGDRIKDFAGTCGYDSVEPVFRTRDDAATWVVLNN